MKTMKPKPPSKLEESCREGDLETVQKLFKKIDRRSFESSSIDKSGGTALHMAAYGGHLEVVTYLVSEGANPNSATIKNGDSPLHWAAQNGRLEVAKYLVSVNANVNALNKDGWSCVHAAAYGGSSEMIRYLLSMNAVPNVVNRFGKTPLQIAEQEGKWDVVYVLKEWMSNERVKESEISNNNNNNIDIDEIDGTKKEKQQMIDNEIPFQHEIELVNTHEVNSESQQQRNQQPDYAAMARNSTIMVHENGRMTLDIPLEFFQQQFSNISTTSTATKHHKKKKK